MAVSSGKVDFNNGMLHLFATFTLLSLVFSNIPPENGNRVVYFIRERKTRKINDRSAVRPTAEQRWRYGQFSNYYFAPRLINIT